MRYYLGICFCSLLVLIQDPLNAQNDVSLWDETSISVWSYAQSALSDANKSQIQSLITYLPTIRSTAHLRSILTERVLYWRFQLTKLRPLYRPLRLLYQLKSSNQSAAQIGRDLYTATWALNIKLQKLTSILSFLETEAIIRWDEPVEVHLPGETMPRKISPLSYAFIESDFILARRILSRNPQLLNMKDASGLSPLDYAKKFKIEIPPGLTK